MKSDQMDFVNVSMVIQEAEENAGGRVINSLTQERRTVQRGRSLGWTFTLHNYTNEHENALKNYDSQFLIYGREVTENGSKHLQGFIQFEAPGKSSHALNKLLPSASWFQSKGCIGANIDYCSKMGDTYHQGNSLLDCLKSI